MSDAFYPDGAFLLDLLTRASNDNVNELPELMSIGRRTTEIERKYRIRMEESEDVNTATLYTRRLSQALSVITNEELPIKAHQTFTGVDQYLVTKSPSGDELVYRFRFGSNRPPTLAVKFQKVKGDNEVRGEVSIPLPKAEPSHVRIFLSTIAVLAPEHHFFAIHQTGSFWEIIFEGRLVEVVIYRVGRVGEEARDIFIEIEPLEYRTPEEAVARIDSLETLLELTEFRCQESIAELYRT